LVTPNLGEAAILAGTDVRNPADMERAGRALVQLGAKAALVKGGHLAGDEIVDVLVSDGTVRRFTRARLDTTSTHGTGCTLSAAIAAGLAHGRPLERAIEDALDFVSRAMAAAPVPGRDRAGGPGVARRARRRAAPGRRKSARGRSHLMLAAWPEAPTPSLARKRSRLP